MILKRLYDEKLAQASYLIGCARTGEACVIDANRDVEQYVTLAASEGLTITCVTETHIHADYVSGSKELAERTGAQLFLSDEGDEDWKYGFASQPNVTLVRDGNVIRIGNVRLDVVKTPGHTPEHIAFILTDEPASDQPLGAFTGDFIFVGDVGRPDLLERAAGFEGTMERGARVLYSSLEEFKKNMPDSLVIWPAHGSGSACGKSLGGVPVSSLGYEKFANWGLKVPNEDEFVKTVLAGQPEPPYYFKEMKRINKVGPPTLGGFRMPARLQPNRIFQLLAEKAIIVDIRNSGDSSSGTLPEIFSIPEGRSFTNWAGWLIPFDQPIYLVAANEGSIKEAVLDLQKIGLDRVEGWFGPEVLNEYQAHRGELASTTNIRATEAVAQMQRGEAIVLDVRGLVEFEEQHIDGAQNIPLGHLRARAGELSKSTPILVHCETGKRSLIAVSVLRQLGFDNVVNVIGGMSEIRRTDAKLVSELDLAKV